VKTTKSTKKKPNRVDQLKSLDRNATNPRAGAQPSPFAPTGQRGPSPILRGAPGSPQPAPGQPQQPQSRQQGMHPFIPGASTASVVPANASEPGSPPGTPNLGSMLQRSFQPSIMERTPLVTGGAGVQAQQPNSQFNFGGANTAPPGTNSMVPTQKQPGQMPGQQGQQ
jgi:hypothetical protein